MTKALKLVWFGSLFAGLFALLWTYASVILDIKITQDITVGRETFFYVSLFVLCATNFLLYFLSEQSFFKDQPLIKGWQYSFGIILNAFFIVSVLFINVFNNSEAYDYNYSGFLIVMFLGLMVIWILALPLIIILRKK